MMKIQEDDEFDNGIVEWIVQRFYVVARGEGDIRTMRNIMITAQRLAEQGRSTPDGYRGAWYYSQHLVSLLSLFCDNINSAPSLFRNHGCWWYSNGA